MKLGPEVEEMKLSPMLEYRMKCLISSPNVEES